MVNVTAVKALIRHSADTHQPKKQCDDFVLPTPTQLVSNKPDLQALLLVPQEAQEDLGNTYDSLIP